MRANSFGCEPGLERPGLGKGNTSWRVQGTSAAKTGVTFSVANGLSATDLFGTRTVNDGLWHHVAGVYDGLAMYLYVDGTLDVSQPSTGTIAQNNIPLAIGDNNEPPSGFSYFFNGLLDEVSLYNRALSADEIAAIFAAGQGGKCSGPQPPSIVTQPADQTVTIGQRATFSVVAGGSPTFVYQRTVNSTNIDGATNGTLTLSNVQPSQAGSYEVIVTNSFGSTNSIPALLTVNPLPTCDAVPSGLVDWWPGEEDASDRTGANNGTLQGTASFGIGEVHEAFSFDGTSGFVSIPNSPSLDSFTSAITVEFWMNSARLTANPTWAGLVCKGNDSWRVMGTSEGNTVYAAFNGVTPVDLFGNRNVNDGQWHHIAATYDGSTMSIYVDGTLDASQSASGVINQNTLPLDLGANSGSPGLMFSGLIDEVSLYNRALSSDEIAAIYAAGSSGKCFTGIPPSITSQPVSQTVNANANVTFSVGAAGTSPLHYQWQFDGTNISNATNSSLTLQNVQGPNAGVYAAAVTSPYGSTISSNAVLTVLTFPPTIITEPQSQTNFVGATVSFTVTSGGSAPLQYQWSLNTTKIAGATNATLSLTNVQLSQAGNYRVSITNLYGSTNSTIAVLTLNTLPSCSPPPSGIADWWRGESNALDSIGANAGTLVGGVNFVAGEAGQAFSFNGTSSYISVPDAPSLDSFTNQITVEFWMKANSTTANPDWRGLVCKGNTSWRVQATSLAKTVTFSANGLSATDLFGTRNVNDGQWHHVAGVYDGTRMYLYVDGTLDASQASTGTISQNAIPLAIGNNNQPPSGHS